MDTYHEHGGLNITSNGKVTDFDIIGSSFYPLWHTTVRLENISGNVAKFKTMYNKKIMILETAYLCAIKGNDSFNNSFATEAPVSGFAFSAQRQYDFMKALQSK